MFKGEEKKVTVRCNGMNYLVNRSEVVWIQANGYKTTVQTVHKQLESPHLFARVIQSFDELPFLKINRSMTVNLLYMEAHSLNLEQIIVQGKWFTVGNRFRKSLKEWLDEELEK